MLHFVLSACLGDHVPRLLPLYILNLSSAVEMLLILQSVHALPAHGIYTALFCPPGCAADNGFKTTNKPRFQLKPKPVKSCPFRNLTMSRRQWDESTSPL